MARDTHYIYCYGGNNNFGDDYILELWIDHILGNHPGRNVIAGVSRSWMQSSYIGRPVYFNDFIGSTIQAVTRDSKKVADATPQGIEGAIRDGYRAADELLGSRYVWGEVLTRIRAFHVAGGGFVNDIYPGSFARVAAMARLAEALDVPLYGTGLGLLPHADPSPMAIELFRKFEQIECRDEESHAFLTGQDSAIRSVFGYDDTFLAPVRRSHEPTRGPLFFVNVQADMNVGTRHDEILKAIKVMAERNSEYEAVRFMHFSQNSDFPFHRKLKAAVPKLVSYEKNTLLKAGLPIQPGDFVLTSRFHCHFLAARSGAKGVYVSARKGYYDIKHRSITRLGSNWLNFDDIDPRTFLVAGRSAPAFDERTAMRAKVGLAERMLSA